MKAYGVYYPGGARELIYGIDKEDANRLIAARNLGKYVNYSIKHIPYLDDCEHLPTMQKVELLMEKSNWCWTFDGGACIFTGKLSKNEKKLFENIWVEEYEKDIMDCRFGSQQ